LQDVRDFVCSFSGSNESVPVLNPLTHNVLHMTKFLLVSHTFCISCWSRRSGHFHYSLQWIGGKLLFVLLPPPAPVTWENGILFIAEVTK